MIEELVRLVDDREVLSASVQRERDKVELVSEAKTRFFAAASHDLRQPLHALSINATTLGVLAARLDHQMLRDVSRGIDSALSQSQSLLDGLLDISLLDAHAVEVRLRPLDLVPFLQEICDEFRAQANASGLQLVVEHHSPSSWCLSDPDQLRRIVHNLVSNSLKFTATGWITLRVDSNGSDVTLQVLDTGLGLPASECEKVFEEFYQFGNPSRDRAQGLGLGLAIVKRTCELLGIRLKFSSTLGVGTVVQLFIAPAEAEVTATPLELPTANEPAFHLSVLLIDDEIQVLQAMERYLTALAWTVRSCATGREAEAALEDGFVPDVLVADYRLRNESGLDVIARLHARIPGLPAVVVTGDTAPARLRELSSQVTAVLHKPIGGKVLVDALVAAVTHHAAVSR
jgi:CheY-like chemotaxis protein